jgi:aspartyl protease family protein
MQRRFIYGFWIVIFILISYVAHVYLKHEESENLTPTSTHSNGQNAVVLKSYNQHYVTYAMINNHRVKCLIDTGASSVSIPQTIAHRIGLPQGRAFYASTANGEVKVYKTMISQLKIGNITLNNVEGNINPSMGDDYVLIGMSALKHLDMLKIDDTLTLRQ